MEKGIKRSLETAVIQTQTWFAMRKIHRSPLGYLPDLVNSITPMPQKLLEAEVSIRQEREALIRRYQESMICLQNIPSWPSALTYLVIQYITQL